MSLHTMYNDIYEYVLKCPMSDKYIMMKPSQDIGGLLHHSNP